MAAKASKRPQALAETRATQSRAERIKWLKSLEDDEAHRLLTDWSFWARPNQQPPQGDWFCWLVLAGRGFGKTRMGAEWIRSQVEGDTPLTAKGTAGRIALVAHTFADGRDVMIEGESGLLATAPRDFRPLFESSKRCLTWPNGAKAWLYTAQDPDQLRGPQHHLAWADEIAKWQRLEAIWSNLLLGLRLGSRPQVVATTTPKPLPFLRELMADEHTVVTRGSTYENKANLSRAFLSHVEMRYANTRLGRQEIDGDILDEIEGALWTYSVFDMCRCDTVPSMERVVVAIDPPVSHGEEADACGIIAAGLGRDGRFYVLEDATIQGVSVERWARHAVNLFERYDADRLVAEVNNGGDLVERVIRAISPDVPYRGVRASRGKMARAEPIAALYEQHRVRHVGLMRELEDELCSYSGAKGEKSPDRMDALVWALSDLVFTPRSAPRMRSIL